MVLRLLGSFTFTKQNKKHIFDQNTQKILISVF